MCRKEVESWFRRTIISLDSLPASSFFPGFPLHSGYIPKPRPDSWAPLCARVSLHACSCNSAGNCGPGDTNTWTVLLHLLFVSGIRRTRRSSQLRRKLQFFYSSLRTHTSITTFFYLQFLPVREAEFFFPI